MGFCSGDRPEGVFRSGMQWTNEQRIPAIEASAAFQLRPNCDLAPANCRLPGSSLPPAPASRRRRHGVQSEVARRRPGVEPGFQASSPVMIRGNRTRRDDILEGQPLHGMRKISPWPPRPSPNWSTSHASEGRCSRWAILSGTGRRKRPGCRSPVPCEPPESPSPPAPRSEWSLRRPELPRLHRRGAGVDLSGVDQECQPVAMRSIEFESGRGNRTRSRFCIAADGRNVRYMRNQHE
jgi:hypothetical protein